MEQVKLTVDEFRKIKNKIINMLAEKEEDEDLEWDRDEEQEKIFLLKYKEAVEELLSYDLSEIPADEWNSEDRYLCTFDDLGINMSSLDFSKTKANIDVNIIYNVIDANDDNVSFKNCNVIFHDDRKFLASCFDEKTIEKNKNIFLSSNFSDELKDKFYNKKVSIEDYKNLTEEQIKEIKEKNFFSLNIPNIKLNNLESEKELYLKLLDITRYYSKEDAEGIIFILSKNINSLNDKKDIIINTVLKSNVEDIKSFALELFEEKLKDIIYIDDYYPDMIKNNYKDVFLIGKKLPNYAIEEYKRNHISLNTFQENYNELHNIRNIETHFDYYLEQINKIVGFEEIYELRKYPKFKEGYYLNSRYIKSNDVEVSIKEFIKEYATYIDNYDVLPNFIKVVDKIDDFRIIDLDKIDSNTLIKDKKQRHIFKTYQLLKTYISETEAKNILEEIVNISELDITKFDYQFLTELSKKSKKNEKTIDKVDFLASITQIINEQIEIYDILDNIIYETIINDGISYSDRMPDRFKKKHPDLFISDDIKFSVLKDSIYKRDITPVFLKKFSEYKEELKRINPMLLQHNLYIYTE